jgi:hypothetical protein
MPDLTPEEFGRLGEGHCPDCDCRIFRPGPRGGAAQNFECVNCPARFNITFASALAQKFNVPHLVFAQRIPSEKDGGGEWREDMFPKVLQ